MRSWSSPPTNTSMPSCSRRRRRLAHRQVTRWMRARRAGCVVAAVRACAARSAAAARCARLATTCTTDTPSAGTTRGRLCLRPSCARSCGLRCRPRPPRPCRRRADIRWVATDPVQAPGRRRRSSGEPRSGPSALSRRIARRPGRSAATARSSCLHTCRVNCHHQRRQLTSAASRICRRLTSTRRRRWPRTTTRWATRRRPGRARGRRCPTTCHHIWSSSRWHKWRPKRGTARCRRRGATACGAARPWRSSARARAARTAPAPGATAAAPTWSPGAGAAARRTPRTTCTRRTRRSLIGERKAARCRAPRPARARAPRRPP